MNFLRSRPYRASFVSCAREIKTHRRRDVSQSKRASDTPKRSTGLLVSRAPARAHPHRARATARSNARSRASRAVTYEILDTSAINQRRDEDPEHGHERDRPRVQTEPALDDLARRAVRLDECVVFDPRRVVAGHDGASRRRRRARVRERARRRVRHSCARCAFACARARARGRRRRMTHRRR